MNNAIYGRTMEAAREPVDFELVHTIERLETCINSPTYNHRHLISDELVRIGKTKAFVNLNKAICFGMAIVDS